MKRAILGLGLVAPAVGDSLRVRSIPRLEDVRLKRLPRLELMALAAARQALPQSAEAQDLAVVLGTGYGGLTATRDFLEGLATRGGEFGSPMAFQQSVHHSPGGQISILLGAQGPALTTSARELSGESALQVALTLLDTGRAKRVLVVAADEWTPILEAGYQAFAPLASADAGQPSGTFPPGEGAAAVLLGEGPGPLWVESCTLTAHRCPVLRFPSPEQFRPLLLEGARIRGSAVSISLAAPSPTVQESERAVLAELVSAPTLWVETPTFGLNPSAGLLRLVAAATRLQDGPAGSACALHGLAMGGGQSITVVRHAGP